MALSRNTKRRLGLYGTATLIATALLVSPRITRKLAPTIPIRVWDIKGSLRNEASSLLIDYLRIDTSNPPGKVKAAAELLGRAFACEGIPYEIVGDDPERPIIVARIAGQRRGGGLMLLSHMDVVPAGDLAQWTAPPFAGQMGEGLSYPYLIGRGTLDMKGQGVANLFAMAELKRAGIVPLHDVVFVGEPSEETFQPELGVGWLMEKRPDLIEGVTDVYNEGGLNEVRLISIERFGVEIFQKARIDLRAYAATQEPLDKLLAFVQEQDAAFPYRLEPAVAEFFRFQAPWRDSAFGRFLVDPEKAVVSESFRKTAPEHYRALLKDMAYPDLPKPSGSEFVLWVVYTLLPGSSVEETISRFRAEAAPLGVRVEVERRTPDAVASPPSGRAYDTLMEVLRLDHERVPVGPHVLDMQYTHSSYIRSKGFRAYGFSPFSVNYQDALKIHHGNERINIELFVEGVERMKRVVREFATRPD